ncbi:MAG: pullulanase [Balneola sp.]|nr:MAG: pullulanase [Balneola sp.]
MSLASPSLLTKEIAFSELLPGYTILDEGIAFKVFAPLADEVSIEFFNHYEQTSGEKHQMNKDETGFWNYFHPEFSIINKWYGYHLLSNQSSPYFERTDQTIADPWSKLVTSRNHYLGFSKTKIIPEQHFDWEGDNYISPEDPRDLIIYETHIKDLVAHPSAKTYAQGIYNDFREANVGGIAHLKRIGVNAVEFLPLQKFAYFEPPFNQQIEGGITNSWNAFSKNYWGYMTSFFFSPETIYASDGTLEEKEVIGRYENAITELKELVKALHKEGISVIMDVVYNHASQYDLNPLRYTAKNHYFRIDEAGNYLNDSWTGNDINTANPQTRQLIIESVKYWMKEFHIDGFRFDLAGIIDWETIDLIKKEAEQINPNVLLIAEPWGGEYKPAGFSEHGWIAWNDRIRNGIKGYDPLHHRGILFGDWNHGNSRFAVENFIRGTLVNGEQGLFQHSGHSLNYLESHDGYTLGDFIRIALNPENATRVYHKKAAATRLTDQELEVSKLAALMLFTSQGITMMHAGQEWARAKVISDTSGKEKNTGLLDRDSYNKDNETNWLNFNEINLNSELFEYYLGLIEFRKLAPALRKALPEEVIFKVYEDPLHFTFSVSGESTDDPFDYFISLNTNPHKKHRIKLPKGNWQLIVNSKKVDLATPKSIHDAYVVPAASGCVLRKLRVNNA